MTNKKKSNNFTFIDLFCGIGGFHQALSALGGTCVFASDIDADCRKTYERNYGLEPVGDITLVNENDIPDHDVLCGGFPCQSFSKAGKRKGFKDETKGTLFFDIMRIVRAKRPKYILLENVRNLASHDNGRTWKVIHNSIRDEGYWILEEPVIFSPHYIGIPQHRERVFIMAVRKDVGRLPSFVFNPENIQTCSIDDVLQSDSEIPDLAHYAISDSLVKVIDHWNEFLSLVYSAGCEVPSFPIWTSCFKNEITEIDEYEESLSIPWKLKFIEDNHSFYKRLQRRVEIDSWLSDAEKIPDFFGAKAKLEWQTSEKCGPDMSIWDYLFQLRPSGIRVKKATYFPALVAMVQIPVVGKLKRTLTPRECARLQSFPDSFIYDEKEQQAYKQFGNSVNVEVVKLFAEFLLDMNGVREKFSQEKQYAKSNALF